jgi:putative restriction endonuclease
MLRAILVRSYFDEDAQQRVMDQARTNADAFRYSQVLLAEHQVDRIREASRPLREVARDQGFRRTVVTLYDHRCGMCGIRVVTPEGHTAVDAAHVVPWSLTADDRPANGMALCRLCHWVFDEGLASVSERYLVIVSRQLTVESNLPGHLSTLNNREIIRPVDTGFWPDLESLAWHRSKVFRRP